MIKTYNAFVGDCDCCQHVNRNRHNVETRLSITDGQITSASCSWCGKDVEVPREKLFDRERLFQGTRLIIASLSDDCDKEQDFLFEGNVYRGYPLGDKSLQSDK